MVDSFFHGEQTSVFSPSVGSDCYGCLPVRVGGALGSSSSVWSMGLSYYEPYQCSGVVGHAKCPVALAPQLQGQVASVQLDNKSMVEYILWEGGT